MFIFKTVKVRTHQRGLVFKDREFVGVIGPGKHYWVDPLHQVRVDVVSVRDAWLAHADLEVIVKAGVLGDQAVVVDLTDTQRALVWIDGRFQTILAGGQYVLWTVFHDVHVEVVDARDVRLEHEKLSVILATPGTDRLVQTVTVEESHAGVLFVDGRFERMLTPGRYAFWKGLRSVSVTSVDLRERILDVNGQDIMTADKVTLRLNAVVVYRVVDARKTVTAVEDAAQALYREGQLALRAVVGTRTLDELLGQKDTVIGDLETLVRRRAGQFGLEVVSLGCRDIILPGEMKDLMNKVTEAHKAAEANLIARREETAAMRSQANTAKLLEASDTLMRLRELEVLEKVATSGKLSVVLGEKGLADRVVNLL